jgi:hypothetical protein
VTVSETARLMSPYRRPISRYKDSIRRYVKKLTLSASRSMSSCTARDTDCAGGGSGRFSHTCVCGGGNEWMRK